MTGLQKVQETLILARKKDSGETSAKAVKDAIISEIEKEPLARIDYVEIADLDTLESTDKTEGILCAIAVYIGKTRLIDNFIIEEGKK